MPNDAGPENVRPIEPSTGKVFPPHSRVSLAPFFNKLRGKRGFAKVQPIKRDAGESPAPMEANAQLPRAENSQGRMNDICVNLYLRFSSSCKTWPI